MTAPSSRRHFVARLGALAVAATALPALLAACGKNGEAGNAAASPPTPRPTTPTADTMGTMSMGTMTPSSAPVAAAATPGPDQVFIENFQFQPATITVPVGTELTWVNHDDVPHTVTSRDGGPLASQALDTDDQYSFRFDTAGAYDYYCAIHPIMNGQVIVK